MKIVKKTIHLIFCDEFPVLRRDLLLKTYDLLLQRVDLTHVVHVRSIVPFRGLKKEYYFFRLMVLMFGIIVFFFVIVFVNDDDDGGGNG